MYYVYELVNLMGGVEYVGKTKRPKIRFYEHTELKLNGHGNGKFYKRQDISMHIVATYATEEEALQTEYELQKFWGFPTDRSKNTKNGQYKLTEDQVREIKILLTQKISRAEIARRFGVAPATISFIKQGKSWSHVI